MKKFYILILVNFLLISFILCFMYLNFYHKNNDRKEYYKDMVDLKLSFIVDSQKNSDFYLYAHNHTDKKIKNIKVIARAYLCDEKKCMYDDGREINLRVNISPNKKYDAIYNKFGAFAVFENKNPRIIKTEILDIEFY